MNSSEVQTTKFESRQFQGQLGPLEDEINIAKLNEKHRNVPLFKGAFKQCKNNAICSEKDKKAYNDWFYRSIYTCLGSALGGPVAYATWFAIRKGGQINLAYGKGRQFIASMLIPLFSAGFFSCYKHIKFIREMDRKYAALYYKSRGKLAV